MANSSETLKCTRYCSAVSNLVVTAPVTLEMSNGINDAVERSSSNTSNPKTTAAIGVVNMEAIAPAAPHPISSVLCLYPNFNH